MVAKPPVRSSPPGLEPSTEASDVPPHAAGIRASVVPY